MLTTRPAHRRLLDVTILTIPDDLCTVFVELRQTTFYTEKIINRPTAKLDYHPL